ncbi:MAG: CBS domain-containing protein [Bacteroidia bacterium]|nr:CBS domain-containing protein [Bacteroidia bacterium]NND25766.1 CBS domain-containing protein [Flavobacteriaceae bacterium]MBT8277388.1 CBS domain-containing protein [Bacteroidia bacterium]NNK59704.1 CBS domain-containing protein [Flavobacteriaceae bacterium]NNL32269.1 CBS domain-containing protein [Flavobacteriaceae bacterium]
MGVLKVIKLSGKKDKADYIHQLIKDIEALDKMIKDGLVEKSPIRIGAEQEFCLVNDKFNPSHNSLDVLKTIDDDHFTTEIGNFNLEINLDPFELTGDCFSKLADQLKSLLKKAKEAASKHDSKVLLTGILPTLSLNHINIDNMTKVERYFVLNDAIRESRKDNFEIHIKGVDELNLLHDSVMLEGCNTSFQMHLQINPDEFVDSYNWAQAISGPILSICTNSPIIFGKELWSESRIALFTQSVDTRANSFLLNEKQSRVSFGSEWTSGSVTDIFKDNISRFRSLVTSEFIKDSVEMLEQGVIPKLRALNLHNGTVYRWNRACYGVGNGKPHLRIENRYIPSGPTVVDEIANMMFWVGVMIGKPKKFDNISEKMDFKDAKANFFNAARYGMATQFYWDGSFIPSHQLILDQLLPMAYKGLYSAGVSPKDAEHYLTIIENRVKSHSGSQWMTSSYRNLKTLQKRYEALESLTAKLYEKQEKGYPVSSWRILEEQTSNIPLEDRLVKHHMSSEIFSVDERDSLELVIKIMEWKNIHHMPVINVKKKLIGLLSWEDVKNFTPNDPQVQKAVSTVMTKEVITISENDKLDKAKAMMKKHNIDSLPVVKNEKLIGIITSKDM